MILPRLAAEVLSAARVTMMPETSTTSTQNDDPGGKPSSRQPQQLSVEISDGGTSSPRELIRALGDSLAQAGRLVGAFGEVRVRLVLDAEMAAAHEEFAGVPGTTDVLTFDMTDPEEDPIGGPTVALVGGVIRVQRPRRVDTDIFVCVDEGKRQAAARGHDLSRELLLYSVHGLLHCLGHDDHDDDSFARMHALEDAILTSIGVGAVFGPATGDSPSGVSG